MDNAENSDVSGDLGELHRSNLLSTG